MNYSTYRASLDIHASGSQAVLHAKKGETKRRILITLTERGKPYLISSDCTAVFAATKPDGNIIYNDCAIDNNIICYNFTEQTTAAEGKLDCEIRLYGADNALIISPGFDLIVDAAVYEDGDVIESGTEVSALTALVSETTTLISTVNTMLENGEFNGPKGEQGPQGPKGDTGATGPKGDTGATGPQGISGVYVGSGDMPDGYNVQIDPDGTPSEIIPYIGANGNWWIGDTDTGKPSRGEMGPQGPKGDTGAAGEAGGYYAPSVTQPDENTLRLAFTPSKEDMPAVADTDITLPGGGGGSVPKPLTYDYMPEGYPNIIKEYTPLVEVQEVNFQVSGGSQGVGLQDQFVLVEGQTYVVIWDGTEYERVAKTFSSTTYFGNLALAGAVENTGEPFLCAMLGGKVTWFADTAAIHTIGVSLVSKTVTPMAEYFLPVLTSPNGTKYKLTVDDSGTISATEVT